MVGRALSVFAVVGMLLNSACGLVQTSPTKKLMGYYAAYNSKVQTPEQIPWALYTDVTFFVAIPELDSSFTYPPRLNGPLAATLAQRFVKEANAHNVNPIMSFGGYTGSKHFSVMVKDDASRQKYAKVLIDYATRFGFKGIDIDWEYAASLGIGCNNFTKADTPHFGAFVKELRHQWPKAQLTAALSINGLIGANGTATAAETKDLVENLDFANIMDYDVFGIWSATTGPLAPIHDTCAPENPVSIDTSLVVFAKQGFKPYQILLGIPAYARSYQLTSPQLVPRTVGNQVSFYYQNHTKTAPQGGVTDDQPGFDVCGAPTGWGGIWLVKELIAKGYLSQNQAQGQGGYTRHFDACSGEPFLTNGTYFFSYDDQFSIRAKAQYAKSKDLAGVFIFDTLGQPDLAIQAAKDALR